MLQPDLVRTGFAGLDGILPGGIPRGNLTLVEGAIGTAKTTLGVEFVYRGASQFNEPGMIVLFEIWPHKLLRDAFGFGWDLEQLERQGRLKIVFTTRDVFRHELQQADSVLLGEASKMGARRFFSMALHGFPTLRAPPRRAPHFMCSPRAYSAKISLPFWPPKHR